MDVRTQGKNGPGVPVVSDLLARIAKQLEQNKKEWLREFRQRPGQFGTLEEQIHQRFQEMADQFVASMLAEATSASPELEREKKT